MAFKRGDLYTSHLGTELTQYFNPYVTKFDSQSFYNFEQDNQPLYDLEERTLYLWEKATGYSTSSLFGMPLLVSGSAPSNVVTSGNVFRTLQAAVDALPAIIRTPTLIEVAASGYLGGLAINNLSITDTGALEIINRGFSKIYSGRGNGVSVSSAGCTSGIATLRKNGWISTLSSVDLSSTIEHTSALSVNHGAGHNVSSLFASNFNRTLLQAVNFTPGEAGVRFRERNDRLNLGFIDPLPGIATAKQQFRSVAAKSIFTVVNYETNSISPTTLIGNVTDITVGKNDVSATRGDDGKFLRRNNTTATFEGRVVAGLTYCNALSSVTINNCAGDLYLRGFCVDGVSGAGALYVNSPYKSSVGISVNNSKAIIENCSVIRSKRVGAKFTNSEVSLSRGFFANRNYEVISAGTARAANGKYGTAGIHAINSQINLAIDPVYASGHDYLFNTQNHTYGILLENSVLTGGQGKSAENPLDATISFGYNNTGIKAVNSTINVSGNLDVYQNKTGIQLINSWLSTDRITVENNRDEGIRAENSVIEYNNTRVRKLYANDVSGFRMSQSLFSRNGQHLKLVRGSSFKYFTGQNVDSLPTKMGSLRFSDSHGVANTTMGAKFSIPAVYLSNSEGDFMHSRFITSSVNVGAAGLDGAAIKVTDGSKAKFMGTQNGASIFQGPAGAANSQNIAGISSENGSIVSFRGPTALYQFGAGVVAKNSSVIEFCPHKTESGVLDISGFNLGSVANHTSVELHTTNNACLVAKDNSQIIAQDVGDAESCYHGIVADTDYPTTNFATYVSGGYLQFYPNPSFASLVLLRGQLPEHVIKDEIIADDIFTTSGLGSGRFYNYMMNDYNAHDAEQRIRSQMSLGGICVQIIGNSTGYINNVNFPAGWAPTPGSYYDPCATVTGDHQLRIWAIGENSQLSMSHVGVSSLAPSSVALSGYHGPRPAFMSGVPAESGYTYNHTIDTSNVCYGAPSSTPGTGTLSVLDLFGKGVVIKGSMGYTTDARTSIIDGNLSAINKALNNNELLIGRDKYENIGPFRLFFGVNPVSRFLGYPSGTTAGNAIALKDTRPYQHLAQGYSLSGNAGVPSLLRADASSHMILMRVNRIGDMAPPIFVAQTSGYYYASAFSESDRGSHVYLDQTAANTFVNAKNCAYGPISGRSNPKVTIYKATTGEGGIGSRGSKNLGTGRGLRALSIYDTRRIL